MGRRRSSKRQQTAWRRVQQPWTKDPWPDCGPVEKGADTPEWVHVAQRAAAAASHPPHSVRGALIGCPEVDRVIAAVQLRCWGAPVAAGERGVSGFAAGTRGPLLGLIGEWLAMCVHLKAGELAALTSATLPAPTRPALVFGGRTAGLGLLLDP